MVTPVRTNSSSTAERITTDSKATDNKAISDFFKQLKSLSETSLERRQSFSPRKPINSPQLENITQQEKNFEASKQHQHMEQQSVQQQQHLAQHQDQKQEQQQQQQHQQPSNLSTSVENFSVGCCFLKTWS